MSHPWIAIDPSPTFTRILVTQGTGDTLLKGRLAPYPSHPRALTTLLEAVALWEGQRVHAVLVADDPCPSFARSSCLRIAGSERTPLYRLDLATRGGTRRADFTGPGRFADLRRLLLDEVER